MLKKLSVYTILIIISGSMTACSNNQPPKTVATAKPVTTIVQAQPQQRSKIVNRRVQAKSAPVEVRHRPVVRHVVPRKSYVSRPRSYRPQQRTIYTQRKRVARQSYRPRRPQRRSSSFTNSLSSAALARLRSRVRYDGSYVKIGYPWGDVPANTGVCTDVVIRSYRRLGIDLQQQVHNDMSAAFSAYPNVKKWGLTKPDSNIDHRRVYNLRAFFTRRGAALPVTHNPHHYKPGDLVTWMVGKDLPHIGIVVNKRSPSDPNRFMVVHNIANGPELDDVLFRFPVTGHYRYTPAQMRNIPKAPVIVSRSQKRRVPARANSLSYIQNAQLLAASKRLGTSLKL